MYEDTLYGGFYTVTGKNRRYFFIAGTDEKDNVVTGRVPKGEFYKWYKKMGHRKGGNERWKLNQQLVQSN